MVFEGKKIHYLIFDFGGVIINIDYQLTQKAFMELGIGNFDELYSKSRQSGLFDELETGKISAGEFHAAIRRISGKDLDDTQIDRAWNAMLLDVPLERIELLEKLKTRYQVFLLSNTNEIHIAEFSRQIEQQFGISRFNSLFNNIYFSSRVGLRKPNKAIFDLVLQEQQLEASHTLFIDDSIQHIEGARAAGLHSLHLEKGMTIEDFFSDQIPSGN